MKHQKFREDFENAGMSQKEYALKKGISPSMVSYYLSLTKPVKNQIKPKVKTNELFSKLEIRNTPSQCLKIKLPNGVEIEIPI